MLPRTRATLVLALALASVTACQLIAGIDSRSEYVPPLDASNSPDTATTPDASADTAPPDVLEAGIPCSSEGKKECLHASQPRTCEGGFWRLDTSCSGSTPGCKGGVCVSSCSALPATCGNTGDQNCCAADVVAKHALFRDFDASTESDGSVFVSGGGLAPANVSDFRLDRYEVTVGRFRAFIEGYPQNLPAAGAGKNDNDLEDQGWDASWRTTATMPENGDALAKALECNAAFQTWSGSTANDLKPINCITWFEAQAFCIWDGGRLPTEAEWMAAAVATDARVFPWGATLPSRDGDAGGPHASFGCLPSCSFENIKAVGSFPLGAGQYGSRDLAGNLHEWVVDEFAPSYRVPCNDCAQRGNGDAGRVVRGGDYGSPDPPTSAGSQIGSLRNTYRVEWAATQRSSRHGFRCARRDN